MADISLRRFNQLERRAEAWRPPLFRPVRSTADRLLAAARRFLDLQAGSLWRDLSVLLPQCHGAILDVGCGAQPYRRLIGNAARYSGIDYADAERHFGYKMPDTTYYDGTRWPVADASMDVVLSTETLEHVPDPQSFVTEAFRTLKPGGKLILTVPFAARWHFIPFDYWRFTPSGLERLLEASDFRNLRVYARGNAVTVAAYKAMALLLPLLMPQGHDRAAVFGFRLLGLITLPILVLLAAVANLSLHFGGGDDCLGYTVIATRPDIAGSESAADS
jgi:SAM-dependent methyltransferase